MYFFVLPYQDSLHCCNLYILYIHVKLYINDEIIIFNDLFFISSLLLYIDLYVSLELHLHEQNINLVKLLTKYMYMLKICKFKKDIGHTSFHSTQKAFLHCTCHIHMYMYMYMTCTCMLYMYKCIYIILLKCQLKELFVHCALFNISFTCNIILSRFIINIQCTFCTNQHVHLLK